MNRKRAMRNRTWRPVVLTSLRNRRSRRCWGAAGPPAARHWLEEDPEQWTARAAGHSHTQCRAGDV
eukprot:10440018-Heterocapsa_arctica.AAC.1